MFPRYSFPPRTVTGLLRDLILARRRSFRTDALACIGRLKSSLHVFGEEDIPKAGSCVVTFNHYYRPNFNAIWMAVSIAATVPIEMRFVMTGELTYPGKWYAPLGMFLSKIVLRRVGRVYGFTTMPPMPPRPKEVEARADAVRRVLEAGKFLGLTNLATAGSGALARLEGPAIDALNAAAPGQWLGYTALFVFGAVCAFASMFLLQKIHDPREDWR